MLKVHQEIIQSNLSVLVDQTDLNALVPELLRRDVFNKRMISRILNPSQREDRQKTDLYLEILKRGPYAFTKLTDALVSSNHTDLANMLRAMEAHRSSLIHPSDSLNSLGSHQNNSEDYYECNGPFNSSQRNTFNQGALPKGPHKFPADLLPTTSRPQHQGNSESQPIGASDVRDVQNKFLDPRGKVFAAPTYEMDELNKNLIKLGVLSPEDEISYTSEKNLPVHVILSTHWQIHTVGKPRLYKMDSNPRGCALLINNRTFYDSNEYPEREGSENDVSRMRLLLKQLHFLVEVHQNLTKEEMEATVTKFSQKPELNNVDCIWVTIMSHGEEGDTSENNEIVGVDGIGYKTSEIIARFFSDACIAGINKPKLFFFQACRGYLTDPGVDMRNLGFSFAHRIAMDGKRIRLPQQGVKVRTQSDIFVVYPAPYGYMANRDRYTGAWFIQAVVDIFSNHAHNTHLEDLLKMVDERIKRINNLLPPNFQAVVTKSIGWSKHLYFNPGLFRDQNTEAICQLGDEAVTPQQDGGMDVVDLSSTNSDKSPNGTTSAAMYLKFKDDDSDSESKYGCFNISGCKLC